MFQVLKAYALSRKGQKAITGLVTESCSSSVGAHVSAKAV